MAGLNQLDKIKREILKHQQSIAGFQSQSMKKFAKFIDNLIFDIAFVDLARKCSLMTRKFGFKNSVADIIKENEKISRIEQKSTQFSLTTFLEDFPTKQEILDRLAQFRFENIDLL